MIDTFQHVFIDNHVKKTLFLLHGTGGSEHDLLPLVKELAPHYNFLGIKGNVSEHGMARFFERDEFGVFDQDSITTETKKLHEFIESWKSEHSVTTENTAFLGYSNGATMILATTFYYPDLICKAVTLHPMLPFKPGKIDLNGTSFFVTYGEQDQLIPPKKTLEVIETLENKGAQVVVIKHSGGHEIVRAEVEGAQQFLNHV